MNHDDNTVIIKGNSSNIQIFELLTKKVKLIVEDEDFTTRKIRIFHKIILNPPKKFYYVRSK
jgi:hypothetical protein